jgi:hypothetical protein
MKFIRVTAKVKETKENKTTYKTVSRLTWARNLDHAKNIFRKLISAEGYTLAPPPPKKEEGENVERRHTTARR